MTSTHHKCPPIPIYLDEETDVNWQRGTQLSAIFRSGQNVRPKLQRSNLRPKFHLQLHRQATGHHLHSCCCRQVFLPKLARVHPPPHHHRTTPLSLESRNEVITNHQKTCMFYAPCHDLVEPDHKNATSLLNFLSGIHCSRVRPVLWGASVDKTARAALPPPTNRDYREPSPD